MSKVYKRFLFIATLFFLSLSANSNPVDIDTAREIGIKFLNANTKTPLRSVQELCLIATYNTNRGEAAFYVFNSSNGFIIVSADDRATPILGYSEEGPFDLNDVPIQMQDYLQDFSEQIQYGIDNQMEAYDKVRQQWETLEMIGKKYENRDVSTVGPLLTDTWNQNCYYNSLCPEDSLGPCGHVYAGCVATSMGQIMRYWEYPISGMGSYTNNSSGYPPQYANFAETQYDWVNMPDKLTDESTPDQVNAVATLLWHCGIAAKAQYGPYETSASCPPLWFKQYFGYSTDLHGEYRNQYVDEEWISMLKDCLDLRRPIQYNGWQEWVSVGHAFVCDGYDENEMFHFNWGWGGNGNGFYSLDAMIGNYNTKHCAVLDIHPLCDPEAEYIVSIAQTPMEGGTASGSGSYYCIESCTLTATPNEGYTFLYWTENDSIISRDTVYSIYVSENRNFVAHFGHRFTVESVPEIGGILSFSNTIPIYGDHDYQRIESAAELFPGDRVVLSAHCNPNNLNHYVAKKALGSNTGSYSVTPFTSETNGSIEMLPDTIKNNIENYYWILNITADANYEFNNRIQEAYSVPVNLNDYASIFTITEGISDPDAWIPNQHGLVISTPGSNKRLCYLHDHIYSGMTFTGFGLWNYDNQEKYVGILDLFTQHADAYTANNNDTVTLLALPNPHYHFVNWTKDGIEYSTNHSISFINTEACHYAANFELNTHEITVLAEPNTGGIVIGSNTYNAGDTCTITATPNQGYTFNYWKSNGMIVSTLPTYSFVVTESDDYVAYFTPNIATQAFELAEGWNWWAPMVHVSLQQLQEALADKGIAINSQSSGSSHRTGATWTGDLQSIIPGQMYRIQANQACTIDLSGMSVDSSSVDLHPGLTWFGYIDAQKPIAQALSGFQPAIGDMINSQSDGFAIYGSNGWSGTLQRLQTGLGYNYLSAAANTKTLSFGASYSNNASYTAVEYIWSELVPDTYTSSSTVIETGVKLNDISKVRCKMKPMMASGGIWLGNLYNDDNQDFRLFATELYSDFAYAYFDYKYDRASGSVNDFRIDVEVDITIEITASGVYVYLTNTGSTTNYLFRVNNDGVLSDVNFLAVLNAIKLGILQIWDANGVLVKDLNAALDSEGTPCMYDEVNKEFIYKSGVDRTMYYE